MQNFKHLLSIVLKFINDVEEDISTRRVFHRCQTTLSTLEGYDNEMEEDISTRRVSDHRWTTLSALKGAYIGNTLIVFLV